MLYRASCCQDVRWFIEDHQRLDSKTQVDVYPMPWIGDLIDEFVAAKYINTLELMKGYWQVPVAEEDQCKTAYFTPFGLSEFKRMPFGLQGAPATFQHMMDMLLEGCRSCSKSYIDDFVRFCNTWEEHKHHLKMILDHI